MQIRILALVVTSLGVASPGAAEVVDFTIKGQVASVEYDYVNGIITNGPGGPASTAFLAAAPVGTSYTLNYSYDTAAVPTFGGPSGASFNNLPIAATFTLAGTSFALPTAGLFVGTGFTGQRYSLFGNFPIPSVTSLAGFRGIDFAVEINGSNAGPIYPPLPASLNIADFPTKYARLRFAKDGVGETAIRFSIDSLTSGAPAVPEPQAWLLMLGGFGLIGATMRRRGRAVTC